MNVGPAVALEYDLAEFTPGFLFGSESLAALFTLSSNDSCVDNDFVSDAAFR